MGSSTEPTLPNRHRCIDCGRATSTSVMRSVARRRWVWLVFVLITSSAIWYYSQQGYLEITNRDIGKFTMPNDPIRVSDLPKSVLAWEGKRVSYWSQVRSFSTTLPASELDLNDHWSPHCLVVPQDVVRVRLTPGCSSPQPGDTVTVDGIIHVDIARDTDGKVVSVYRIDAERVTLPTSPVAPERTPSPWLLVPAGAIVILVVIRARKEYLADRAEARRLAGRCVWCGYDLRASSGICPECGQPIRPTEMEQQRT
jgi:hypothetical protein